MFEADSQNFPWRQEDSSFKNFWPAFGGDHRGTLGGAGEACKEAELDLVGVTSISVLS